MRSKSSIEFSRCHWPRLANPQPMQKKTDLSIIFDVLAASKMDVLHVALETVLVVQHGSAIRRTMTCVVLYNSWAAPILWLLDLFRLVCLLRIITCNP